MTQRDGGHGARHVRLVDLPQAEIGDHIWHPVRRVLGATGFGVGAYSAAHAGDVLVGAHDEKGLGSNRHEELYVVLAGRALFEVDGQELELGPEEFLLVEPETRRGAHAIVDGTSVLVIGGAPGAVTPAPYEHWYMALTADNPAKAAEIAAGGLTDFPAHGQLNYQLACFRSLAGELDAAAGHLRRAVASDERAWRWLEDDPDRERNDVAVEIDRVPYTRLPSLAAAEAKAGKGHDVFGFLAPPASYEDNVIDHADVVAEVERAVGRYGALGKRSTYNPKTKTYFGVSNGYVPSPTLWRHDVWQSVGESPASWDHVRTAAPKLRELGHPIGIGQSAELDSNLALTSLLMCFGSFLQTEANVPAIDTPATIEAVRFVADLWKSGQDSRVFSWNAASNNQCLLSGEGSLVLNAISAVRSAETLELPFVDDLWLWPIPSGPKGRLALGQYTNVYSIWKFAKSPAIAERFVADLCIDARQATVASGLFSYPSFPGAFRPAELYKFAAADPHQPKGKYSILTTVALEHTRNAGYPGTANAAVMEALSRNLVPYMFARVSLGKASAEDSVAMTAWELKRIWRKWKAAGKV